MTKALDHRSNQTISFADALAYAEEMDRLSDEVQGYTASREHSQVDKQRVWHLLSDGDEWLADVWVDADGVYHIARDVGPNELPIERARSVLPVLPLAE